MASYTENLTVPPSGIGGLSPNVECNLAGLVGLAGGLLASGGNPIAGGAAGGGVREACFSTKPTVKERLVDVGKGALWGAGGGAVASGVKKFIGWAR